MNKEGLVIVLGGGVLLIISFILSVRLLRKRDWCGKQIIDKFNKCFYFFKNSLLFFYNFNYKNVRSIYQKLSYSLIELKRKFMIYGWCEIRSSICLKWFIQFLLGFKGSIFYINFNYMFEVSYFEFFDDSVFLWDLKQCRIILVVLYLYGFLFKS